jgi:hypothetical protein
LLSERLVSKLSNFGMGLNYLAHTPWHLSVWYVAYRLEQTIPRDVARRLWREDEGLKRQRCFELDLDTRMAMPSRAPDGWQIGDPLTTDWLPLLAVSTPDPSWSDEDRTSAASTKRALTNNSGENEPDTRPRGPLFSLIPPGTAIGVILT